MTKAAVYFANHARRTRFPWSLYHGELERRVARALEPLAEHPRVLVVGCGLDLAAPGRPDAILYGADLDERAIDACRDAFPALSDRLGVCPTPYELPAFGVQFDAIVAKEVIEHLHDPTRWVQSLVPHLAPRGRLVLTTPNYGRDSTLSLLERSVLEWVARRDGYSRADIHPSPFDRARFAALDVGPRARLLSVEVAWSRWSLVGVWQAT